MNEDKSTSPVLDAIKMDLLNLLLLCHFLIDNIFKVIRFFSVPGTTNVIAPFNFTDKERSCYFCIGKTVLAAMENCAESAALIVPTSKTHTGYGEQIDKRIECIAQAPYFCTHNGVTYAIFRGVRKNVCELSATQLEAQLGEELVAIANWNGWDRLIPRVQFQGETKYTLYVAFQMDVTNQ